MADQPSSSRTPSTLQSPKVVYRSSRTSSATSSEHSRHDQAGKEENDDVVVFDAQANVQRGPGAQQETTGEGAVYAETTEVCPETDSPRKMVETAVASRLRRKLSQGARRAGYKRMVSETSLDRESTAEDQPLHVRSHSESFETADDLNLPTFRSPRRTWFERRGCRWCLGITIVLIFVAAIVAPIITILRPLQPTPVTPIPQPPWLPWRNRTDDNGLPRILLWNTRAQEPLSQWFGTDSHIWNDTISCKFRRPDEEKCSVTNNRRLLERSDAIVFYAERLFHYDIPRSRAPPQMWVFWARSHLPPIGKDDKYLNSSLSLPLLSRAFNWTMGHRKDADVVIPYGNYHCTSPSHRVQSLPREEPRKDVAWLVDDCEVNRFETETLRPSAHDNGTVRIRLFPACGASECGSPSECIRYIAQRYHFIVVSLEPVCFQSANELIYRAFKHSVVPVILAPPGVRLHVPEHSVVSSAELHGKGELAKYLRSLLDHPDKYYSYFAWKRNCSIVPTGNLLCSLCHALRETPVRRRPHPDVLEWWTRRSDCSYEPLFGLEYGFVQVL